MRPLATFTAVALALGAMVAAAAPAAAAVVTGTSTHGTEQWRLDGRQLTIELGRPLDAAHPHRRSTVHIQCGEETLGIPYLGGIEYVWAALGRRILPVPGGARSIRATLRRDVSQRADRCLAYVGDDDESYRVIGPARVSLVVGQRPRCDPGPLETVLFRSPHAIVTHSAGNDGYDGHEAWRWCRPPTGAWHPLETGSSSSSSSGSVDGPSQWILDGDRLAWVWERDPYHQDDDPLSSVRTIDFADPAPHVRDSPAPGSTKETTDQWGATSGLVMAPSGTLAWITLAGGDPTGREQQHVEAWHPGGATVALDTVPASDPPALAALAISTDGTTATWTDGGVARSASLPAGG